MKSENQEMVELRVSALLTTLLAYALIYLWFGWKVAVVVVLLKVSLGLSLHFRLREHIHRGAGWK